jgi:hypothetical protein
VATACISTRNASRSASVVNLDPRRWRMEPRRTRLIATASMHWASSGQYAKRPSSRILCTSTRRDASSPYSPAQTRRPERRCVIAAPRRTAHESRSTVITRSGATPAGEHTSVIASTNSTTPRSSTWGPAPRPPAFVYLVQLASACPFEGSAVRCGQHGKPSVGGGSAGQPRHWTAKPNQSSFHSDICSSQQIRTSLFDEL